MAKTMDPLEREAYGRRLRSARETAGLSQQELGQAIGHTQSYVSKVEAGEMMFRPIDYPPLAQLLGVPILALIGPLTEEERAEIEAFKRRVAEERRKAGYDEPTP